MVRTTGESYKAFVDSTITLQERNVRFALDMVGDSIQELHRQAESNRILTRELAEQSASRRLAENPADTYAGFLFTPFSYYRQVLRSLAPENGREDSLPFENYDGLTVQEVSEKLEDLSEPEVRAVRSYERRHKNRGELLERFVRALV